MKIDTWGEARSIASALNDFLGKHCPKCGRRHTNACIDGGRCVKCGTAILATDGLVDAVQQAKDRLFP